MPLTFQKLHNFLIKHGLVYRRVFSRKGSCTHVEVLSGINGEAFLIYIPSRYEIEVTDNNKDFYEVDYIDVTEEGTIAEDYAEQINPAEIQKTYDGVMTDTMNQDDLASALEESYRHNTVLSEVVKQDMQSLRNTFRQLRRLRLCVQNLMYKITIMYKNYMCSIRRDDTLEGFSIVDYPITNQYRFLVTIDLETMYQKMSTVVEDVQMVRESLYMVLTKNQTRHAKNLDALLLQQRSIKESSDIIRDKRSDLERTLRELSEMLVGLARSEKDKYIERNAIQEEYDAGTKSGIHKDIEKGHKISAIDAELSKIDSLKQDVIRSIMANRLSLENLAIRIDTVFFDNSVMLDEVSKNFQSLEEAV